MLWSWRELPEGWHHGLDIDETFAPHGRCVHM
jgi:hypothetical protein